MPIKREIPDWSEREDIEPRFNIDLITPEGEPKYEYQNFEKSEENDYIAIMYQNEADPKADLDDQGFVVNPQFEWRPVPWVGGPNKPAPYGYKKRPDNFHILDPIPEQLEALERGKKYLKKYSYGTVARWISAVTGRHIDYVTLWKRVKFDKTRDKKARAFRKWAARYKAALLAAEYLESEIGAGRPRFYDEEGNVTRSPRVVSSQPRLLPADVDDGTPAEEVKDAGKRRRGPRRPRSTR
jgi:hypothetical protein